MDLISIIVIIVVISKIFNKANQASSKVESYGKTPEHAWKQAANENKQQVYQNSAQNEEWKRLARENIEKAKRRTADKLREVEQEAFFGREREKKSDVTYQMPKRTTRTTPAYEQMTLAQMAQQQGFSKSEVYQQASQHRQQENRSAMQQVHEGRIEARNTSILQRAKANADEDKIDVTLASMEAEHHHSERVLPAEHYHPEDEISDNLLGKIEDLMIKGYDGNLCFERDFVGEAMDMISRFSVPSDIPNFGKDDVA